MKRVKDMVAAANAVVAHAPAEVGRRPTHPTPDDLDLVGPLVDPPLRRHERRRADRRQIVLAVPDHPVTCERRHLVEELGALLDPSRRHATDATSHGGAARARSPSAA